MRHNVIRYSMMILVIGLLALAAGRADAQGLHRNEIIIESYSLGIAPGQTARLSVVNVVFMDGSVRFNDPIMVRFQLLDTEGEVIAQSAEIEVGPGKIRFWDVPRETLPAAGGPRVQVRGKTFVIFPSTRPFDVNRDPLPLALTVELIDSGTGRTVTSLDVFVTPPIIDGELR